MTDGSPGATVFPVAATEPRAIAGVQGSMDRVVSIGGAQIHARVAGSGAPTVVFEAGACEGSEVWRAVEPAIAERATTVLYDRRGTGRSAPVDRPRRLSELVDELEVVLDTLRPPRPLLLVGHSLGGLLVRLLAARRPGDVAGLVLVDPFHEDMTRRFAARLSPRAMEELRAGNPTDREGFELEQEVEVLPPVPPHGDAPLIVLSGQERNEVPASVPGEIAAEITSALHAIAPALQRQLAERAAHGRQVSVEGAGHHIHRQRPDAVIDAILSLLRR